MVPLTSNVGDEESPSFSPDGNQVAYSWNGERAGQLRHLRQADRRLQAAAADDGPRERCPARLLARRSIRWFRGIAKTRCTYVVTPAIGGRERIVAELPQEDGNPLTPFGSPSWSAAWLPDGKSVVLDGLRLLSLETGELREPDRFPIDGPSSGGIQPLRRMGVTLAFARPSGLAVSGLHLLDFSSDGQFRADARTLSLIDGDVWGLTWTADSRALVYPAAGCPVGPVSRRPSGELRRRLAPDRSRSRWERMRPLPRSLGLRLDWPSCGILWTSTSGARRWRSLRHLHQCRPDSFRRPGPTGTHRYSPDGSRVAFESTRTGESTIWVAGADGSNAEEVFSRTGKHSGTPRWAPDSQRIAFDSSAEGNFDIYVIQLGSARPLRLTTEAADDAMPSWSPDGTWIYFASDRTGRQEVWKMPAAGGPAVQVTRNGGACVYPSADGRHIYYTKHDGDAELWTQPLVGGQEHQVLPSVVNRAFVVLAGGIYFIPRPDPDGQFGVYYLDLAKGGVQLVTRINGRPDMGLAVSPDRQHILYVQIDQVGRDLVLVNGFR